MLLTILAITVVVLLLMVLGVLHFRTSMRRTEITIETGKVVDASKKAFAKGKDLMHRDEGHHA